MNLSCWTTVPKSIFVAHGRQHTVTAGYQPHSPGPQSTLWLLQILLFSPICHMVLSHQVDISFLDNTQCSCLACLTSILATSSQELISPQYFFHKRHPLHPPYNPASYSFIPASEPVQKHVSEPSPVTHSPQDRTPVGTWQFLLWNCLLKTN